MSRAASLLLVVFVLASCSPAPPVSAPVAKSANPTGAKKVAAPVEFGGDIVGVTTRKEFQNRHAATKDGIEWPVWSDGDKQLAEEQGLTGFSDGDKSVYASLAFFDKASSYEPIEGKIRRAHFKFAGDVLESIDITFNPGQYAAHAEHFRDELGEPSSVIKDSTTWTRPPAVVNVDELGDTSAVSIWHSPNRPTPATSAALSPP